MTIKESVYFKYDGINSNDEGIWNIKSDSGLYDEALLSSKRVVEDKIEGRHKPYKKYVERDPLEIPVSFYFSESWNDDQIRRVARWLNQEEYKPLIFESQPNKIYYAMVTDSVDIIHNGLKQGYLTLTFKCDTYHAFSSMHQEIHDLSSNTTSGTTIEFNNQGDIPLSPTVIIQKVGVGDVSIVNNSNGGKEFKISNLVDTEEVTIDNEYREITTNQVNTQRYTNFNMNWMELLVGVNRLQVYGDCKIAFQYELKLL